METGAQNFEDYRREKFVYKCIFDKEKKGSVRLIRNIKFEHSLPCCVHSQGFAANEQMKNNSRHLDIIEEDM